MKHPGLWVGVCVFFYCAVKSIPVIAKINGIEENEIKSINDSYWIKFLSKNIQLIQFNQFDIIIL